MSGTQTESATALRGVESGEVTEVTLLFPPISGDHMEMQTRPQRVTVLEDRAQVRRIGEIMLHGGQHRLVIMGVSPIAHDLSVRGEVTSGEAVVTDASVQRAVRVRRRDLEPVIAGLDAQLERLETAAEGLLATQNRLESRAERLEAILSGAIDETPEDAGWGLIDAETWRTSFASIFERRRAVRAEYLETCFDGEALARSFDNHRKLRIATLRPDAELVAWVELLIDVKRGGNVSLAVEYAVPNAMWRPRHRAVLSQAEEGARLAVTCEAAVWQNTGEDWVDVELVCSTARASLGTSPPELNEDLLDVTKKASEVVVEAREVAIQTASVGGSTGAPPSTSVELPGVDDGGEVQALTAAKPVTIVSDGRPAFVPLFVFDAEAKVELVTMPELAEAAIRRVEVTHTGDRPLLAGPVELVSKGGGLGWTELEFVSPGEVFELGFGPSADVRVSRHQRVVREETDTVDKWHRRQVSVDVFLSNLSGDERTVRVTERVPVAEIEHVRVRVLGPDDAADLPENVTPGQAWPVDDDGMCVRDVVIAGHRHAHLRLIWELATAPDVRVG